MSPIARTDVPRDKMDSHLQDIEVGETAAIKETQDRVTCNLWMMKKPDYIMKMMTTGGNLIVDQSCGSTVRC